MKIRQGFVSNSSSSSFVVMARTEPDKCEHCGRFDPDMFEELDSLNSYSTSCYETVIRDKEESLEELKEWLQYESGERFDDMKRLVSLTQNPPKGWKIRLIDIGYSDSGAHYIMESTRGKFILLNDGLIHKAYLETAEKMREESTDE